MNKFCLSLYNFIRGCGLIATMPYENFIMIDYRLFHKKIPNQSKQEACENISYCVRINNNKIYFILLANLSYICDSDCTPEKLAFVLSQFPFDYPQFANGMRMNISDGTLSITHRIGKPIFSPIQRTYDKLEEFFVNSNNLLTLIISKINFKLSLNTYTWV